MGNYFGSNFKPRAYTTTYHVPKMREVYTPAPPIRQHTRALSQGTFAGGCDYQCPYCGRVNQHTPDRSTGVVTGTRVCKKCGKSYLTA